MECRCTGVSFSELGGKYYGALNQLLEKEQRVRACLNNTLQFRIVLHLVYKPFFTLSHADQEPEGFTLIGLREL
jgi:hypothetical protein